MRLLPALPRLIVTFAVVGAMLALSCGSAADLIPGDPTPAGDDSIGTTPTPVIAPPILAPADLGLTPTAPQDVATIEIIPDAELVRSVVQIQLLDTSSGFVRVARDGSGVVIDREQRLILTSYMLVTPYRSDGGVAYSSIAIAVTRTPGEEPELTFEAQVVAADPARDLAVLRATRLYRGDPLDAGGFALPSVTAGEPKALESGDAVRLLGHPGTSGNQSQAVISTTATIMGIHGDEMLSGRALLSTNARMPYGVGGGPVFDAAGALIGIATQLEYNNDAVVALVRPLTLAADVVETARRAGPLADYAPPLQRIVVPRGGAATFPDGIAISTPAFAENAVERDALYDLFDYTSYFPLDLPALYYEYSAQGIPDDSQVEERWYLDGILQDALSSSYRWMAGSFAVVSDRLVAPSERGIPAGRWTLEVWAGGILHASGTALFDVPSPGEPVLGGLTFGALAAPTGIATGPTRFDRQLLTFFDFEEMRGVSRIRWIVFRDGRVVYQSPLLPWQGGEEGSWWIGYSSDEPIGSGFWEFEVYMDSPAQPQPISRGANGITLQ
jgi:S1-C subfamily serine protease